MSLLKLRIIITVLALCFFIVSLFDLIPYNVGMILFAIVIFSYFVLSSKVQKGNHKE
ncbi:hypothetical protein GCM10008935_18170 [Alkalibacillus silvisoli]|uniref:Uncharacterized protein n=1 Tax=Alkalibacillus silvisoli TaxID=392823 RepID=A0ABP3JSC8_9BACI